MVARYFLLTCLVLIACVSPHSIAHAQCCNPPGGETASFAGMVYGSQPYPMYGAFAMTLQGGSDYSGSIVQETDVSGWQSENYDSCWWAGNPDNLPQTPSIIVADNGNGGVNYWSVAAGNTYQYDYIGLTTQAVWDIQYEGRTGGVPDPCGIVVYQQMQFVCQENYYNYQVNKILYSVASGNPAYQACRYTPASVPGSCSGAIAGPPGD